MASCGICGVSHAPSAPHGFVYATEDAISEEMRDPIDKRPIFDPKDLPCGHTFSSASIIAHLRAHGACPVDHEKYSERDLSNPSASLRRILDALKVVCPNKCSLLAVGGVPRDQLAAHITDCPLAPVPCPNVGCPGAVARQSLTAHIASCPHTPVPCPHKGNGCTATPLRKEEAAHDSVCDFAIVPCENKSAGCRETMARRLLAEHNTTCAYHKVPCTNSGCSKKLLRKELGGHVERECDHRTISCTQGCGAAMQACDSRTHNCVASLRQGVAAAEGLAVALKDELTETRIAAHTQLAAHEDAIAALQRRVRDSDERIEALISLLGRAVGEHHNFARALTDTAGILTDARRRGRPANSGSLPVAVEEPTQQCEHMGCDRAFVPKSNHALACRFHPGQLRMRNSILDFNCCNRPDGSPGCAVGKHVADDSE